MAAFSLPDERERIDFRLMYRSPARLFTQRQELDEVLVELVAAGYHVVDVEAGWTIPGHMFADLASAFHACCHDNFGCLDEGMDGGIADALSESTGVVLALRGFDTFVTHCWDDAQRLLALICHHAWQRAVLGDRVICLVQSDRMAELPPVRTWSIQPWHADLDRPAHP